jgi:hypothetical protein
MRKTGGKGGKKSGNIPEQKAIQPHAPDRGRSAYVPNLGFHYGSSGLPTTNIGMGSGARLYRPLPRGL